MISKVIEKLEKNGCTDSNLSEWYKTIKTTLNIPYANTVLDWMPSDTEELFRNNIKDNKQLLQKYIDKPIEYKLNEYGFRTNDSFDNSNVGNVFLGCSHTFGIGHYLENTWSYKLNKFIGGKFYNLSQPGCGIETDFRMIYSFKDYIKIKNVFHFVGFYNRYEFIRDDMFKSVSFSDIEDVKKYECMFESHGSTEKLLINQITNLHAIQNLCNEIGVNYYVISDLDFFNNNFSEDIDIGKEPARDLIHFSVETQNKIYNKFKKLYISNKII